MPWLTPSILATMTGTAILVFIYHYLWVQDRQRYLGLWAASWAVYFVRFIFMLLMVRGYHHPAFLFANQSACLISGILLLAGTYRFIDKQIPKLWIVGLAAGLGWVFIGVLVQFSFHFLTVPTFTFLAAVYIRTGFVFLKSHITGGYEKSITGWSYILWGLHKANYPFLRPVTWFAPWGYLLGAVLEFSVALGTLLVYFQKVRKELKDEQYLLRKAQEMGKIGSWDLDLKKNELTWSAENYRIFGLPEGIPLTYETFLNCVHPEDREYVDRKWKASLEKGTYDIEHRVLTEGGVKWVREKCALEYNEKNECVRGTGFTQDITGRRMAENALRKSEHQFREMIKKAPLPIVISGKTGEVIHFNDKFTEFSGYTLADFNTLETWWETVYPDETYRGQVRQEWNAAKEKAAAANTDMEMQEWELTVKDGSKRTCEFYMVPLDDISLIIIQDITEKRKMAERLQHAQKMESIGSLAGGIAHDFNNILFPIVGISEMLMEDLPAESPEYQNSREIFQAAMRASALVEQILAFSRQSEQKRIPVAVQSICKEVVKLCRSTIPSDITIVQDLQKNCRFVMADPAQMHQVLMNLMTNAYHAVEQTSGEIFVKLREISLAKDDLSDLSLDPGLYVLLTVSDTGAGIQPHIMEKIFDPYFTTKEKHRGTGLGLSVVYGIIKEYGGEIKVSSTPGKGTVFRVYLPLADEAKEPATEESRGFSGGEGNERILLVDDEEQVTRMLQNALARLGYSVTSYTGSQEALEVFKRDPAAFDLVVTDMTMPGMTGDKLAREMMAIRPDLPVIICTGFSERISREKADALGIKGFLMKPVVVSQVAGMIRKMLDGPA